jgi:3-methyladenine DNA glycosylase/8-oxoguanine DNA glycosylase
VSLLVRETVTPRWGHFALPRPGLDGLLRRRGGGLVRLLHHGAEPVVVAMARPRRGPVMLSARAGSEAAARHGIARMRFALGVDDDLADFHAQFRDDPVIGRAVRAFPGLRTMRRPEPFEALAWALTEQLIDMDRAVAIQRRLIRAFGRRCARTGLWDAPSAAVLAAAAPARVAALDLAPKRALTLRRAAAEVSCGRVDLARHDPRRLAAINGIGPWTLECLALYGQGRLDVVPAGDLGYLKLVGRLATGHPRAFADEAEVRGFFARYAPWAGLAGEYLRFAASTGRLRAPNRAVRPAGTRSSAAGRWSAAA